MTLGSNLRAFDGDRFRREGHAMVDWIAAHWASLADRPVRSTVTSGWVRAQLPTAAPEMPESLEAVMADLDRVIVPGLTHWQHPSFFAYFPANASGPSILGELLSAGLGVQGMLWSTSPACTELETHVLDWLVDLLGLPPCLRSTEGGGPGHGGGVIQDTASSGVLCALVAARERATDFASDTQGVRQADRAMVAYASLDAHSSVEKAARIAGVGNAWVRKVPTDAEGAMDAEALARLMQADADAGHRPFFVAATVGTTACGAVDPVTRIAELARTHDAWLHVDAAWAGAAALCPEFRAPIVAGAEHADSWGFNPHKWMLVNFDCHAFWVRDRRPLVRALSVLPEYLRNAATESGQVIDYRDWQVPLGRRFRALKLWMTLRMLGAQALRTHIRDHVAWAGEFADLVQADPRFELLMKPNLSLVCLALREGDAATTTLLDRVNATGRVFLTHARVKGRMAIRLAVGGTLTRREHVLAAWELLRSLA
ncbi:MAG: aminotransferase class V-fold PLP-dependent enzyme [Planctomycetes bacterium]|nr:aminotransferase class V-fold PLP-dependent enzyme [Planctomycetota bacterium]